MTLPAGPPRKLPKHLMAPGQARPVRREPMSLSSVQRWVMSTLAATTVLHLSAAMVLAALYVDKQSSQVGLLVIAAAFGVIAVGVALAIHQRPLLSPWLALGVVPGLVGAAVLAYG